MYFIELESQAKLLATFDQLHAKSCFRAWRLGWVRFRTSQKCGEYKRQRSILKMPQGSSTSLYSAGRWTYPLLGVDSLVDLRKTDEE
jgi:hypothetical protein